MKNLMVLNVIDGGTKNRNRLDSLILLLNVQIENSLDLGWSTEDIIVMSNIDYNFMDVSTSLTELNLECLTGSKMFAIKEYYKDISRDISDVVFCHDLDCWQNVWFEEPEFKDIGIARYSNKKFNGGSLFWKHTAKDLINEVVKQIADNKENKEEPTLNRVLKDEKNKDRVTVLDNTFNVGCSGYVKRYNRSKKPIHVVHFHPYNRIAWETHALDRNDLGVIGITVRLERLLRKYYPELATKVVR